MADPTLRNAVEAEARSWCGTPVRHRERKKGVSVDCLGVILCTGISCGVLDDPGELPPEFADYGRMPNPRYVLGAAQKYLVPVEGDYLRGDIAVLGWNNREVPTHYAIMAENRDRATMIHADGRRHVQFGHGRVVEVTFSARWPSRVHSYWRYPGLVGL